MGRIAHTASMRPRPQPRRGVSPAAVRHPLAPASLTSVAIHSVWLSCTSHTWNHAGGVISCLASFMYILSPFCLSRGQIDPLWDDGSDASTRLPVTGDPSHVLSFELCEASAEPHAPRPRRGCPVYTPPPLSRTGFNARFSRTQLNLLLSVFVLFCFYFDTIVVRVLDFIFPCICC